MRSAQRLFAGCLAPAALFLLLLAAGPGAALPIPVQPDLDVAFAFPAPPAVSPDGDVVLAWQRVNPEATNESQVMVATRPRGGQYTTPVALTSAGGFSGDPHVVMAANGDATIVYTTGPDAESPFQLQAVTRRADGRFTEPVNLTEPSFRNMNMDVAGAPDGTVVVTWMHLENGVSSSIQASIRRPNGAFSAPVTISDPDVYSTDPQVGIAHNGVATIVYEGDDGSQHRPVAVTLHRDGTSSAPTNLADEFGTNVAVAVTPNGRATAAWTGGETAVVKAATKTPNGAFGAAVPLSPLGEFSFSPVLAAGRGERVTIAWSLSVDGGALSTVQAVTQLPSGTYAEVVDISEPATHSSVFTIAAARNGTVVLGLGKTIDGANDQTGQIVTSRDGITFSAPVDVDNRADRDEAAPLLAVGPAGALHLVWRTHAPDFSTFGFSAGLISL